MRGSQAAWRGNPMDQRVEDFLADVLALEGEDANTVREGVRGALVDCEQLFRAQEVNKRMKEIKRGRSPVMLNHQVEVVEIYRVKGMDGVNDYVNYCNGIVQRAKEHEEAKKRLAVEETTDLTEQNKEENAND